MSGKSISIQANERANLSKSNIGTGAGSAPIRLVESENLQEHIDQTFSTIARRAFEMFENDGWADGHHLDHWFKAEAELLHPVHVQVAESTDALTVRAEVPGFNSSELRIGLDPLQVTISGRKESSKDRKSGKTIYAEQCSSEILRVIELPTEINVSKATTTLKNGILEISLPKAIEAKNTQAQAAVAGGR